MKNNKTNIKKGVFGLVPLLLIILAFPVIVLAESSQSSSQTSSQIQTQNQNQTGQVVNTSSTVEYPTDAIKSVFKDIRKYPQVLSASDIEKRNRDIEIIKAYIASLKKRLQELSNSSQNSSSGSSISTGSDSSSTNTSGQGSLNTQITKPEDDSKDEKSDHVLDNTNMNYLVPHRYIDDLKKPVNSSDSSNTGTNINTSTDTNIIDGTDQKVDTQHDNSPSVSSRIYSDGSISAFVYDSKENRAGTWGQFFSGSGFMYDSQHGENDVDWLWKVEVRIPTSKTVKSINVYHEGSNQAWSTSESGNFPIVVFYDGKQQNHRYNDLLPKLDAGVNTLKLYGQKDNKNQPGTNITIEFTDGTYLKSGIGLAGIE